MRLTNYHRGIETKYIGPTNFRGARIKAKDGKRSCTISYPHEISGTAEKHFEAVKAFMEKYEMDWGKDWGYTSAENAPGYIFFSIGE